MSDRVNLNMILDPETAIARGETAFLEPREPMSEDEFAAVIRQLSKEELNCLFDLAIERGLLPVRLSEVTA